MTQTEASIESDLIEQLKALKYGYRADIYNRKTLEDNFKEKFEELNKKELEGEELTENEFKKLLDYITTPKVYKASKFLRERNEIIRDSGEPLYFSLMNTEKWCENTYEVVSQIEFNATDTRQRYDALILINGLPIVHVELKNKAINPKKAMEQIIRYKNERGNPYTNSIMCFIQLFIVSNHTDTKYFANNDEKHFTFNEEERYLPICEYAGSDNEKINNLDDFTKDFLSKHNLGEIISRYIVTVESEKKLVVMRPYQMYAVKAIIDQVGNGIGNGYIWHTTGSGKTLTSFKASTIMKENLDIDKCIFVVDRKDLDRQTRDEFNRFQPDCVEENTSTKSLIEKLQSDDRKDKVIVTTIQKLGIALGTDKNIKKNYREELKPLKDKRIVFIFDECHRSQFGDNHKAIKKFFPSAQLFGFTGTPIFEENAIYHKVEGNEARHVTTEEVFQKCLHSYTITHAIEDKNVLKFRLEYYGDKDEKGVKPHDAQVIPSILEKHDKLTRNRTFNAFLATESIMDAFKYYHAFKDLQEQYQKENPNFQKLNIACIYSPPADGNPKIRQMQEDLPNEKKDKTKDSIKKENLEIIIKEYNEVFGTNHNISEFDEYYKDIQLRIKNQKFSLKDFPREKRIDILIVVDMLLTGFDSVNLNTLYVDKGLRHHGLIQAFSRTNRVLNETKPFGNIIDYRYQRENVNRAVALFSGKDADKAREIWIVEEAKELVKSLKKEVQVLEEFMEKQNLDMNPSSVLKIKGDASKAEFITTFQEINHIKGKLEQYTDIDEETKTQIESILPEDDFVAYKTGYVQTVKELKDKHDWGGDNDLLEEEPDYKLYMLREEHIDYDFIMSLLETYSSGSSSRGLEKMTKEDIISLIKRNPAFMNEGDEIEKFIGTLKVGDKLSQEDIEKAYEEFKNKNKNEEISKTANKYGLKHSALENFLKSCKRHKMIDDDEFEELLDPLNLDWEEKYDMQKSIITDLLTSIVKYYNGDNIQNIKSYL